MRSLSATSEATDDCNLLPITQIHHIDVQALNPLPDELSQHEEQETKKTSNLDGTSENEFRIIIGNSRTKSISLLCVNSQKITAKKLI